MRPCHAPALTPFRKLLAMPTFVPAPRPTSPSALLATLALVGAATAAHAQAQKPGLWEHSTQLGGAMAAQMAAQVADMKRQMAQLPPEQRKMMEQMLAQQGMALGADGTTTLRYCLTPEQARQVEPPSHDEDCRYTVTQRSASSMRARFVCTDEGQTQGEGEWRWQGDQTYEGRFKVQTLIDGQRQTVDMTQRGRWLGATCPANLMIR